MKKVFLLIVLAIFMIGPIMAQKQVYFGAAASGLTSVITNQNNYGLPFEMDYKVTLAAAGNAIIGFDFSKNVGLRLEVGYSKLGQKYEDFYKDTTYTRNVKLNYIQLPLMFKYRTSGEVAKFYVMAGPQFNFLTSAKELYYKQGVTWINDTLYTNNHQPIKIGEETITERFASLDVMGRIDFGIDIVPVKNLSINIGITMAYGFMDINATDYQNLYVDYKSSHNIYGGLNFGLCYVLPLGEKK